MFTFKNLSSKASTTIINLDEQRKNNYLDDHIRHDSERNEQKNDEKKKRGR